MKKSEGLRLLAAPFLWLHRHLLPTDRGPGWTPYLWLIWIGFFFIPWAGKAISTSTLIATIVALLLFLPLYFRYWWMRRGEGPWIIALIVVLGCALLPFNVAGGALLIYAGSFAGYSFRPRVTLVILAAFATLAVGEYLALGMSLMNWLWAPVIIVMVGLANLWSAERERQHCALERSQAEVKRLAAVAERERIGRDLHDLLGHTLTLITVKAELAAKLAERDLAGAAHEIRELEAISRDALRQVREAVGGYRAGGLAGEVVGARIALQAAGVEFASDIAVGTGSDEEETALAMVLREAVTNVVRHADARHCSVSLRHDETTLTLEVRDDGRGGRGDEGNGMRGMRERLEALGGTLTVRFDPQGTTLRAMLPLAQPEGAAHAMPQSRREANRKLPGNGSEQPA